MHGATSGLGASTATGAAAPAISGGPTVHAAVLKAAAPDTISGTPPNGTTIEDEVQYLSGVTSTGTIAAISGRTWNGDGSDSNAPDAVATYNATMSQASKWGPSETPGTTGGTQTYYFDPASNWTPTEQALLGGGFALWSAESGINWVQTNVAAGATVDFIRGNTGGEFAQAGDQTSVAIGGTTLANQGAGTTINITTNSPNTGFGDITFGNAGIFPDTYPIQSLVHEEGHVMGFYHGGAYNGAVNSATQQFSPYDTRLYTIMSYIEPEDSGAKYYSSYSGLGTSWNNNDPTTPMMLDILAAQRLYGAPAADGPLSGGQVFGFNTNIIGLIRPFFDFTVNVNPIITLFDTGTGNSLDLSGYTTAETVNLNAGTFSSFDGLVNNVGIAFDTKIDGFVGDSADDTVTVNGDNDTINGGGGTNTVLFAGVLAGYVLSSTDGVVTATNSATGVTDVLTNIQALQFSDQTVQTSAIPCYCTGTRIDTPFGTYAVEDLCAGDVVSLANGSISVVTWIGHRRAHDIQVVRIRKDAFGPACPRRDLFVSDDHAMAVGGYLVPAGLLVNGDAILFEDRKSVTLYHVELAIHAIMLAEGAPAESYLDTGNRAQFTNCSMAYDPIDATQDPCGKMLFGGPKLDAVRASLRALVTA